MSRHQSQSLLSVLTVSLSQCQTLRCQMEIVYGEIITSNLLFNYCNKDC